MAGGEGEQILRVLDGDVAEQGTRAGHVAGDPAARGGQVSALARQQRGEADGSVAVVPLCYR
jgi:hypothetical protein